MIFSNKGYSFAQHVEINYSVQKQNFTQVRAGPASGHRFQGKVSSPSLTKALAWIELKSSAADVIPI
jgi:hypothetical protein